MPTQHSTSQKPGPPADDQPAPDSETTPDAPTDPDSAESAESADSGRWHDEGDSWWAPHPVAPSYRDAT